MWGKGRCETTHLRPSYATSTATESPILRPLLRQDTNMSNFGPAPDPDAPLWRESRRRVVWQHSGCNT